MTEAATITHWLQQEPETPFYAVIFISRNSSRLEGYQAMDEHLMNEGKLSPAFWVIPPREPQRVASLSVTGKTKAVLNTGGKTGTTLRPRGWRQNNGMTIFTPSSARWRVVIYLSE